MRFALRTWSSRSSTEADCDSSNSLLVQVNGPSGCSKHVSSIEKETAQALLNGSIGWIIIVRRIMVTIVVATMAGACISGVYTIYVLCVQLQELIKAVRLLVLR